MTHHEVPRSGSRPSEGRMTMLELVRSLVQEGLSEHEVVNQALDLVEGGQVILTGNFRDTPLRKSYE